MINELVNLAGDEGVSIFTKILVTLLQILYWSLLTFIKSSAIFIFVLSIVYIIGRCLNLVKKDERKNFIAITLIFLIHILISINFGLSFTENIVAIFTSTKYIDICIGSAFSIILYVGIGFKLYDRMDSLLDKKIAPDKPTRKSTNVKARSSKRDN